MQYSPTVFTVTLGVGLVCDSTRVDGGWVGERLGAVSYTHLTLPTILLV